MEGDPEHWSGYLKLFPEDAASIVPLPISVLVPFTSTWQTADGIIPVNEIDTRGCHEMSVDITMLLLHSIATLSTPLVGSDPVDRTSSFG